MIVVEETKPQCGGGKDASADYNLGLHVGGLFLFLVASTLGCGFPVAAKKIRWLKIPPRVFFICKHFGTGVLLATAFVHLLPTAFANLTDPCLPDLFTDRYPPLPGVVAMTSLLVLFVVEMVLNARTGGHSHGGPTGQAAAAAEEETPRAPGPAPRAEPAPALTEPGPRAEASTMPPWFEVFYEQYVRQHPHIFDLLQSKEALGGSGSESPPAPAPTAMDARRQRKLAANLTLLECGILFHSVFVGIAVALAEDDGYPVLLTAILFHQLFEGLGLGARIAAVPFPPRSPRPWLLVLAFGLTGPLGQAVGIATRSSYDPRSAFGLVLVGVFNAISAGLLVYATLIDLLAEDFLSEEANLVLTGRDKARAFFWVLAGASAMSVVGAFV
ncbi:hypothetical protein CDD83_10383 [Cordyceps sp. RAO-2017]|nr:hypothetical protein CDD83_10383 [Cordyceps sp. RAO-2017]